jgi:hypothetical protein
MFAVFLAKIPKETGNELVLWLSLDLKLTLTTNNKSQLPNNFRLLYSTFRYNAWHVKLCKINYAGFKSAEDKGY